MAHTRRFHTVIVGMLLALSPALLDDDVVDIMILTPSGWYLIVRADGSGVYGYGSGIGMQVQAGTFDLEHVLRKLQASLNNEGKTETHYGVSIRRAQQREAGTKYSQDHEIVGALFETARQAARDPKVDDLWERRPPTQPRDDLPPPGGATQPAASQPSTRPATRPSTTRATTQPAEQGVTAAVWSEFTDQDVRTVATLTAPSRRLAYYRNYLNENLTTAVDRKRDHWHRGWRLLHPGQLLERAGAHQG